jgi:gas vesicle protein
MAIPTAKAQGNRAGSNNGTGKKTIVGGTIAAVAAIGALLAGTFLLAGPRGKKNRATVRGWMIRAKGEVLEKLESMKDVSAETYVEVVDAVLKRYKNMKDISAEELAEFGEELRSHWNTIAKEMRSKAKTKKQRGN